MLQKLETPPETADLEGDEVVVTNETNSFGVLDAIAAILENFRLLTLAPLLAAGLTAALALIWPATYTSTAYLAMNDERARATESLMRTPKILEAALLTTIPELRGDTSRLREASADLRRSFEFAPSNDQPRKMATIFELRVTASDPEVARKLNAALITAWLEATKPGPINQSRIEKRIAVLKQASQRLEQLKGQFRQSPAVSEEAGQADGSRRVANDVTIETQRSVSVPSLILSQPLDRVPEALARELEVLELEDKLIGATRETVIAEPQDGVSNVAVRSIVAGGVAGLLTALVTFAYLLIRKAISLAPPRTKAKWAQVRELLPRRRGRSTRGPART